MTVSVSVILTEEMFILEFVWIKGKCGNNSAVKFLKRSANFSTFKNFFYCRETVQCFDDLDCQGDLRCVVGYCGDQAYLDALVAMPCEEDYLCEDLHLGPECCLDVGGGVEHILAGDLEAQWGKKCCDNIRAPVTVPAANISLTDDTIAKVRELKPGNMNKIFFFSWIRKY